MSESGSCTPASPSIKITSCSGWCGLSTIRAILFLPDFLKYILYVLVWATTLPPIGRVGSPKNTSGDAITWFVANAAQLYVSAILTSKWTNLFNLCWRTESVPLPRYSALNRPTAESTISNFMLFSRIIWLASSKINVWCALLYARATIILSRAFSGSIPCAFAMDTILSGLNVFSVSIYSTVPSNPPSSFGFWTVTHIVWQNCVLPDPNSP